MDHLDYGPLFFWSPDICLALAAFKFTFLYLYLMQIVRFPKQLVKKQNKDITMYFSQVESSTHHLIGVNTNVSIVSFFFELFYSVKQGNERMYSNDEDYLSVIFTHKSWTMHKIFFFPTD